MAVVSQAFHGYGIETFHGHDLQTFRGSSFCICWKRVSQLLFPFNCSHLSLSRNPLATLPQPRLRQKKSTHSHTKPWCREYGLNSAEKDFRIFAQMQPLLALGCQPFLCQKPFWLLPNDFFYPYYLYFFNPYN